MHEMSVSGQIQTLAWREGSTGIFTGSIEGLYEGFRFGSTTADEQRFVLDVANGSVAVVLRQEIATFLAPKPPVHPWSGGNDPTKGPPTGGPPPGMRPGGPPPGLDPSKPPHRMKVTLRVDPEQSAGIFAGASGELELDVPSYRMAGYLVVKTSKGDLRLDFMEHLTRSDPRVEAVLAADLTVDGANSTGIYANARGELTFALTLPPVPPPPGRPPNLGVGPYSGTIWLEQAPV